MPRYNKLRRTLHKLECHFKDVILLHNFVMVLGKREGNRFFQQFAVPGMSQYKYCLYTCSFPIVMVLEKQVKTNQTLIGVFIGQTWPCLLGQLEHIHINKNSGYITKKSKLSINSCVFSLLAILPRVAATKSTFRIYSNNNSLITW